MTQLNLLARRSHELAQTSDAKLSARGLHHRSRAYFETDIQRASNVINLSSLAGGLKVPLARLEAPLLVDSGTSTPPPPPPIHSRGDSRWRFSSLAPPRPLASRHTSTLPLHLHLHLHLQAPGSAVAAGTIGTSGTSAGAPAGPGPGASPALASASHASSRQSFHLYTTFFQRALAHERVGDVDKAIKDYATVVAIHPECAAAYFNRSGLYASLGRHDVALQVRHLTRLKMRSPL